MKKAAAITLAAFYLLLTTGMFVCIVHCTAQHFIRPKMAMHSGHSHRGCKGGKGCSCCDKHGSYAVKENIKPAMEFYSFQAAALTHPQAYVTPSILYPVIHNLIREDSNGPPGVSGKDISIRFRSLLI